MFRKISVYVLSLTILASALNPATAAVPPPPPVAVPSTASTAFGVGGGLAVGIIATAGILCIYDFWQKLNGQKNWDGTPKAAKAKPRQR